MRLAASFLLLLALAGCGGPVLPYSKEQPTDSETVHPPWEALVQAGPGAENDIDLETLNGPMIKPLQPAPLENVSPPSEPEANEIEVAADTTQPVEAPKAKAKPKNRIAIKAVAVPAVSGAPGNGNAELARAMRDVLNQAGWPVLASKRDDALTISGKVVLGKAADGVQKIKLVWVVATPDGKVLGDIIQENEVPAGSLDAGFGENARFAVEAAAAGIFELIQKFR
jgi:hypothetical protein